MYLILNDIETYLTSCQYLLDRLMLATVSNRLRTILEPF